MDNPILFVIGTAISFTVWGLVVGSLLKVISKCI